MNKAISYEQLLYSKQHNLPEQEKEQKINGLVKGKQGYTEILEKVTDIISTAHSKELAEIVRSEEAAMRLKSLIKKYLIEERLLSDEENIEALADKLYESMAGLGFLREYIDDESVEEININAFDNIWVQFSDRKLRLNKTFANARECTVMIKKLAALGGLILDGSAPQGDSFLSKGVRMSAAIPPVVDVEAGGICSIRRQKKSFITKEMLIKYGTATDEELMFLSTCLQSGISIAIAGETGAGKTADMNYLLSTIKKKRLYTIEDTKELQLDVKNAKGQKINDLVQLYTKEPPHEVTMNDLLKLSLRFDPDIIVPAEMRGAEAQTAVEAGRTGHTILSSLHANGCRELYDRILTMYLMSSTTLSEERILEMIVDAFPIAIYKNKLEDGSRKYMEIFEATGIENGKVKGNTLFKFLVSAVDKDDAGEIIKIHGRHVKCGGISDTLAEKLKTKGVEDELIKSFQEYEKEVI